VHHLPRNAADLADRVDLTMRTLDALGVEQAVFVGLRRSRRSAAAAGARAQPTIVVHGEKDLVVPFDSARDMAERADGALYRVPGAYHSWMLANPRHGAELGTFPSSRAER
jgi:pimeloyl-ACP methyl ester carboxylesterase